MSKINVNGVQLFYELSGSGEIPVVLVHGSWVSHHTWDAIFPRLEKDFRILTYDRRGHSQSDRPVGQGSIRDDVSDLAALLEHLELAPAWVVGNSAGASIAFRLAAEHPKLLIGLLGHEPPLLSLVSDDPDVIPMFEDVNKQFSAVVERIASGDHAGAAEQFIDSVVLGPGAWAQFPLEVQNLFIENAPTFLDEAHDPEAFSFDLKRIKGYRQPVLITTGDHSPPIFAPVIKKLVDALPQIEIVSITGAGHIPHETHPDAYVEAITTFIQMHSVERSSLVQSVGRKQ